MRKKKGQRLSSLAVWSIFIGNKPLGLTLFPSIKNLADSWDDCRTSAAPSSHTAAPGSPGAKPCVGGPSGIPVRSCLIVTLSQVTLLCALVEASGKEGGGPPCLHSKL